MNDVKTIFSIGEENYSVEGCGQSTVSAILNEFPNKKVILAGFFVNGKFVKADLTPSFKYT